ncbi:MAG: HEAT repeat domain-containing protein [Planctomycetota bacterium]
MRSLLCAALCCVALAAPARADEPNELDRWTKVSPEHAAVVEALRRFERPAQANGSPAPMDLQQARALEEEVLAALRGETPTEARIEVLEALLKALKLVRNRVLLAKALAGTQHALALAATERSLQRETDPAIFTTLARTLPETPASVEVLLRWWALEGKPLELRRTALRELARRQAEPSAALLDVLARGICSDPEPELRAEAITLAGRQGDARCAEALARAAKEDADPSCRQRALVAYAEVAGVEAIPLLEAVALGDASARIQASAVLALGRAGGPDARAALRRVAEATGSAEIKARAQRLLEALEQRDAK